MMRTIAEKYSRMKSIYGPLNIFALNQSGNTMTRNLINVDLRLVSLLFFTGFMICLFIMASQVEFSKYFSSISDNGKQCTESLAGLQVTRITKY